MRLVDHPFRGRLQMAPRHAPPNNGECDLIQKAMSFSAALDFYDLGHPRLQSNNATSHPPANHVVHYILKLSALTRGPRIPLRTDTAVNRSKHYRRKSEMSMPCRILHTSEGARARP